ncbi:MAG: transposase, partial [Simkania negevensis]|nr:transposase [Simkania negevensis]
KHPELEVNFFEVWIDDPKQGKKHFSWITDLPITKQNVYELVRGGRARWKIENETFNTLKSQGYEFEHNFGHGREHLCHLFTCLMILALPLDQIQQHCCGLFKAALQKLGSKRHLWERVRSFFVS